VVIGTDCIHSCKSIYHKITSTTAPYIIIFCQRYLLTLFLTCIVYKMFRLPIWLGFFFMKMGVQSKILFKIKPKNLKYLFHYLRFGLWCLMPLSTIFHFINLTKHLYIYMTKNYVYNNYQTNS
jgi:hypothetical protein